MSARDLSRPAPVPEPPSRRSVWTVRAVVLVMLAGFVGVAWLGGAPDGVGPRVLLAEAAVVAAVGPGVVWRWADRPRLTSAAQWTMSEVLDTTRRDTVKRALRAGDALPAQLQPWARAYAKAQQSTVLPAGAMLIAGAVQLAQAAAQTNRWVPLTGGVVLVLPAAALLWRLYRLHEAAARLTPGPTPMT